MESRLWDVPFGRPSVLALVEAVGTAKGSDPLAPVTVVVPSNTAGLSLRRGLPGVTGAGLVNVRFLVLARLAELLGAPRLAGAGRRPLTPAVRAACVGAALRQAPGIFAEVADHPSTARALDAAFRELRAAPPAALDRLVHGGGRAADVVRLYRAFRHVAAGHYDEDDLAVAAADAVRVGDPAVRDVGDVVLHLPGRLTPPQAGLVDALAADGRLRAVLGRTGEPAADAAVDELAARLGGALGDALVVDAEPAAAVEVVSAPDPETELRLVARRVVEGTGDDPPVPLHRVAVLTRQPAPYALLAHGVLHGAGIPHNGPAVRTLSHVTAGRVLLGLLALPDRQFRRTDVAAWLSSGPIRDADGDPVPAGRWDRLSKEAGIVRGPRQWDHRLAKLENREDRRLAEALAHLDDPDDVAARHDRHATTVGRIRALRAFVAEAVERLAAAPEGTWAELSAWATGLLRRYLGTEGHLAPWPEDELESYRRVESVLGDLGALDEVHPAPDLAVFRRALERELEAPAGRVGRFGEGVFVGRLADAVGLDVDRVFVVGMVEGAFPPRAPLDALLSDADRHATGGALRTADDRRADERRTFLAAMAAASSRVLSAPRVDPRSAREAHLAPWLAEQAVAPFVVPSFAALVERGEPASEQERDLADLWAWHDGSLPADHPLLSAFPALGAGVAAITARNGGDFTEWDGNLGRHAGLFQAEEPLSATRVQDWAVCPRRYLLGRVLGLREVEEPEEFATLSPRDRGSLVHEVLERLVREGENPTSPDEPWGDAARKRAVDLAEQVCDDYESQGRTGTSLLWRLERRRIVGDVLRTLEEDDRLRRARWVSPVGAEVAFGIDGADAVSIPLDDGRLIPFRGFIDRVDRSPDGSRLVVLDYKTGRRPERREVEDGMVRGTMLQLPLYAQAARDRFGGTDVEAYYWHVSQQGAWSVVGYSVDDDRLGRLQEVLSTIVHGIEDGVFPGRPGGDDWRGGFENCRWCDFDRVCPSDRDRAWDRMREAPELGTYVALSEATAEDKP